MSGNINDIALPRDFLERMKLQLGDEYNAFVEAYKNEAYRGFRINRFKISERNEEHMLKDFGKIARVPWTDTGYYYGEELKPGKHPLFDAGAYYIQEPSAMLPAELIDIHPGDIVLDLCAAPGGKSTRLAERLFLAGGGGFLIANEYVASRAKILSSNIERLGISNAVVLNESPDSLETKFAGFFDSILVDAPCSGEGMFRKNPEAISEWSPANVELCAKRQRDILSSAHEMLKPGGCMVYSTCTFAPQENEENIRWFCDEFPDMELVEEKHVYPHRVEGEGHFVAKLVKNPGNSICEGAVFASDRVTSGDRMISGRDRGKGKKKTSRGGSKPAADIKEAIKAFEKFEDEYLNVRVPDSKKRFELFGERLFLVPKDMPSFEGIKCVSPGLELGTLKKNRFEPAHALAMYLAPGDVRAYFELGNDAAHYQAGNVIDIENPSEEQSGWILMCVDGIPTGWGKLAGGRIKNHYPKGLRR